MMTVRVKSVSRPVANAFEPRGRRSHSVSISEQRRPLLLPQEVQALGTDDSIIFYERLRPIRCKKIRYFTDRRFQARLLPAPRQAAPPRVAPLMPNTPSLIEGSDEPQGSPPREAGGHSASAAPGGSAEFKREKAALEPMPAQVPQTREATMADIERIDQLTLEEFAMDFSKVVLPKKEEGERMTDEEMNIAVESFLNTLRGP
jgi:type IV secretion system protein VirD4